MADYVFGANILENLTTGMYKNSQIIFREYIQNSCDAIDKAVALGILSANEENIDIWIDTDKRFISVEDNGTGITAEDFEITLQSIAQSNKQLDTEKGFRGIGRLCGLAYCRELIFSTTAKNENVVSTMRINAEKLRSRFYGDKKYTAQEVLDDVITVEKKISDEVVADHWFKVEMIDINDENEVLLDVAAIRDYLSFVAPVEYRNTFFLSQKIYEHADSLNFKIDEYRINLNGDQLVKKYKTDFKTSLGEDEIFDLSFKNFYDEDGKLIAWSWIGISKFKGVIKQDSKTSNNKMRSIRLRKGNIQIGDADALQKLFSEERGIHYFIGEVFAVDKNLIPNSQRDYFIENSALKIFKNALADYFEELHKVYYGASDLNSAVKNIKSLETAEEKFKNQVFVSKKHQAAEEEKLTVARDKAESYVRKVERRHQEALDNPNDILSQVTKRIIEKRDDDSKNPQIASGIPSAGTPKESSNPFPKLNRKERKLVYNILDVIRENIDAKKFEELQSKIVEAVNK